MERGKRAGEGGWGEGLEEVEEIGYGESRASDGKSSEATLFKRKKKGGGKERIPGSRKKEMTQLQEGSWGGGVGVVVTTSTWPAWSIASWRPRLAIFVLDVTSAGMTTSLRPTAVTVVGRCRRAFLGLARPGQSRPSCASATAIAPRCRARQTVDEGSLASQVKRLWAVLPVVSGGFGRVIPLG